MHPEDPLPLPAQHRAVQFVSDLVYGDAVASDCVQFHRVFQRWGLRSVIYASRLDSHHQAMGRHFQHYRAAEDDLLIFHYSCWSDSADYLLRLGKRMVLVYHNVTPPEYFAGTDPAAEMVSRRGREGLPLLGPLADLALGVSEFNRLELAAAGYRRTGVLPILMDQSRVSATSNPDLLRRYGDGSTNLLFVGRVVPNKRHDDLIRVLYHYTQIDPAARLFIVGSHDLHGPYCRWLTALADRLGLADQVHFTGQVSDADLAAYFRLSHVFLCLSDHEGFCVPLVEAMQIGLPVIAHAAAAVPHTAGDAALLVHRKDPAVIAELVNLVRCDSALRECMIRRGRQRAADFAPERVESALYDYLQEVIAIRKGGDRAPGPVGTGDVGR